MPGSAPAGRPAARSCPASTAFIVPTSTRMASNGSVNVLRVVMRRAQFVLTSTMSRICPSSQTSSRTSRIVGRRAQPAGAPGHRAGSSSRRSHRRERRRGPRFVPSAPADASRSGPRECRRGTRAGLHHPRTRGGQASSSPLHRCHAGRRFGRGAGILLPLAVGSVVCHQVTLQSSPAPYAGGRGPRPGLAPEAGRLASLTACGMPAGANSMKPAAASLSSWSLKWCVSLSLFP